MTKNEKEIKRQIILTRMDDEVLKKLGEIGEICSDAWQELDSIEGDYNLSYTDIHNRLVKLIRRYGFC